MRRKKLQICNSIFYDASCNFILCGIITFYILNIQMTFKNEKWNIDQSPYKFVFKCVAEVLFLQWLLMIIILLILKYQYTNLLYAYNIYLYITNKVQIEFCLGMISTSKSSSFKNKNLNLLKQFSTITKKQFN